MLSAYHHFGLTEAEEASMRALEQQLMQPEDLMPRDGLTFREVAEALDTAESQPPARKRSLVAGLVDHALHHSSNPPLQLFGLLRVLLPQMDNRSVYGFKTTGLLKSLAKAMEKEGGLSGKASAAQLLQWIRAPHMVDSGPHLITTPEITVARLQSKCFGEPRRRLTLLEAVALCQRLTLTYKERHKQATLTLSDRGAASMSVHIDSVAEVLGSVLPALSYLECKLLIKLLLRTVPIGVGPQTVLQALGPSHDTFLTLQNDLSRLAVAVVEGQWPALVCGVPFTPMTCHVTSSPYLMKFLFAQEDTVKRYLTPKDGRLVVHSSGRWYVPLVGGNSTMRKRFVDLECSAALGSTSPARSKHMQLLREIKRSQALLKQDAAVGYLLSYMLYQESEGSYVFLLRGAQRLSKAGIEFADAPVDADDPKPSNKKQDQLLKAMLLSNGADKVDLKAKGSVRITTEDASGEKEKSVPGKKGMLAQRKMDGDRMQAHIMMDTQGKPCVRLFTKRGRPVHRLYTDVAQELERAMQDQPCILDGEIIAVSTKDGMPLPWCSAKWRYDSGNAGAPLSSLLPRRHQAVNLVGQSTSYGYNPEDGEESGSCGGDPLTFAPDAASLAQWEEMGASERERIRVKPVVSSGNNNDDNGEGGRLLFVVFDVLMLKGKPTIALPYSERLERLKRMPSLNKLKHTQVIAESWYVQNADEVNERMAYIIKQKGEGLILKDPRAKYDFARSLHQRKLKISGPDINCGVVGLGFTQSRNPRMWGLLTCIRASSSSEEERLLVYNRVETLEGDKVKTAAEHVLGLTSLVPMHSLLHGGSSKDKPIKAGSYSVYATVLHSSVFTVTWESLTTRPCVLYFLQGPPKDVQWLCNPLECRFGLSQRGDVYPVDWRSSEPDTPLVVLVPRFPVGRIQLDDHQRSELDSPSTIEAKFREAANEKTCLQDFFIRKVRQLRNKPPDPKKLEELRRILTARENTQDTWPQPLPRMFYLKELSALLVKYGFEELSKGERMVLSGYPKASQWDPLLIQQVPIITLPSEEDEEREGEYDSLLASRLKRLSTLKQALKRPVLIKRSVPFTGQLREGEEEDPLYLSLPEPLPSTECLAPVMLSLSDSEEEEEGADASLPISCCGSGVLSTPAGSECYPQVHHDYYPYPPDPSTLFHGQQYSFYS
jgi:ATP-dependent DNA ligase